MNIVKKNNISEKEYRTLSHRLSSSDIRTFNESRKRFYKQVVCGEQKTDDESISMLMGHLVDCMLTTPDELYNRYHVSPLGDMSGQVGELVEELYQIAKNSEREFEEMFNEAVNIVKYRGGLEELKFKKKDNKAIYKLFVETDKAGNCGEALYKEKLLHKDKKVVGMDIITSAEKIAQEIASNEATGPIVTQQTTGEIDVHKQLVILYKYKGIEMRSMLDIVHVDHINKTINPYDIKVTWSNDEGFHNMYLKGLYIQAAVYDIALRQWAVQEGIENYEVLPMQYPVGDSRQENSPVLHTLSKDDIAHGYSGFYLKGNYKYYKGVDELIDEIKFHMNCGNWANTKKAIENRYRLAMDLNYQ